MDRRRTYAIIKHEFRERMKSIDELDDQSELQSHDMLLLAELRELHRLHHLQVPHSPFKSSTSPPTGSVPPNTSRIDPGQ